VRVWILTSELTRDFFAGGIARYVENFARLASLAGHEFTVIGRSRSQFDERPHAGLRIIGVQPRYEEASDRPQPPEPDHDPTYPYNVIGYSAALSHQMAESVVNLLSRESAPDVIECQEYAALAYYLLKRKLVGHPLLAGIPIVVQLHGAFFEMAKYNHAPRYKLPDYWTGQMERFCLTAADALLCPSRYMARSIQSELVEPLEIASIPLPFLGQFDPPADGAPGELVYFGRLEMRKGVVPLVDACARLWRDGANFRLSLIGADTHFAPRGKNVGEIIRGKHERWIKAGNLDLVGTVPFESVRERLRCAWAALIPSLWENFPNTCIEAMAAGQLAVGSMQGGQAEMIHADGVNGILFDWNKPADAENAIRRTLGLSPAERREIIERGTARIRAMCHPDVVIPQRIAHFERVIESHKPRAVYPTTWQTAAERTHRSSHRPALDASNPRHARTLPHHDEVPGLVSVIVPYYNLGPHIDETLASALASSYRPLEVLIVNDGSTDPDSLEKLCEIEARGHPDVRIIHTANQGLPSARNNGVRESRGEFLALLDADDKLDPAFIARGVAVMQRYANVGFVYGWVRYFDAAHGMWPTWDFEPPYGIGHNMTCTLAVVRRSAFVEVGGNDPAFEYGYEDFGCWVGMLDAGWAGVSLDEPTVFYRVRENSMIRGMNDAQTTYLYGVLTRAYPELIRRWGRELFCLQAANGPSRHWNHPATHPNTPPDPLYVEIKTIVDKTERGRAWSEYHRLRGMERLESLRQTLTEISNAAAATPGMAASPQ
jgi:glycogen synthase